MPNKYEQVREVIVKAVPEIMIPGPGESLTYRPITLSHVLIAIQKKFEYPEKPYQPEISIAIDDLVNQLWNLHKSLADQDENVIDFLHKLLCN